MIMQSAIKQSFFPPSQWTVTKWEGVLDWHQHPPPPNSFLGRGCTAAATPPEVPASVSALRSTGQRSPRVGAEGWKAEAIGDVLVLLSLHTAGSGAWKHLIFWNSNSLVQWPIWKALKSSCGTSLPVQGLRLHGSIAEAQVWSLVRELRILYATWHGQNSKPKTTIKERQFWWRQIQGMCPKLEVSRISQLPLLWVWGASVPPGKPVLLECSRRMWFSQFQRAKERSKLDNKMPTYVLSHPVLFNCLRPHEL